MEPEICGDTISESFFFTDSVDFCSVLGGDQDRVDRDRLVIFINHTHLGLTVWQQVIQSAVMPDLGQLTGQAVGQADRQRHEFGGLVAGEAEHDSLVTRSDLVQGISLMVVGFVDPLGYVWRLLV